MMGRSQPPTAMNTIIPKDATPTNEMFKGSTIAHFKTFESGPNRVSLSINNQCSGRNVNGRNILNSSGRLTSSSRAKSSMRQTKDQVSAPQPVRRVAY